MRAMVTAAQAPRVDPVRHVPGSLATYPWAAALRAPAYRAARTGTLSSGSGERD